MSSHVPSELSSKHAKSGERAPEIRTGRVALGMTAVDRMFGGGVPLGVIVDVYGSHGTGKTQIVLQAAARFAASGRRVLFVDTAGTFRPERVLQMSGASSDFTDEILGMISVARVQSVAEQTGIIEGLLMQPQPPSPPQSLRFGLVIVDSLTDLFSYEYSRYGSLRERNRMFFAHMRSLARLAVCSSTTVMVTNMVRTSDGSEVEHMQAEADLFSHVRIHLAKKESVDKQDGRKKFSGSASCVLSDGICHNDSDNNDSDNNDSDNNNNNKKDPCPNHSVEFTYAIASDGITTSVCGRSGGCDSNNKDNEVKLP